MKLLMIEDNEHKISKITISLQDFSESTSLVVAKSYNSAIKLLTRETWDLVFIDMSIPTFDKSFSESGGRSLTLGGLEIIRRMKRKKIITPFVVVTQFTSFSDHNGTVTLQQIKSEIESFGLHSYLGTILFDTTKADWKNQIHSILANISK